MVVIYNRNKNMMRKYIVVVVYILVLLNTNDLIISAIFVGYELIYYILEEVYFFIRNVDDIKKILKFYYNKSETKRIDKEWNII